MNNCAVCGRLIPPMDLKTSEDWDWFCGYLKQRVVFCPDHKQSSVRAILRAYATDKSSVERFLTVNQAIDAAMSAKDKA